MATRQSDAQSDTVSCVHSSIMIRFSQFPELKTSSCCWVAESKSLLSRTAISADVSKWWSWELLLCFLFFMSISTVDDFIDESHTELYRGEYWLGSPVYAWENHKHVSVPPQHTSSVPLWITRRSRVAWESGHVIKNPGSSGELNKTPLKHLLAAGRDMHQKTL